MESHENNTDNKTWSTLGIEEREELSMIESYIAEIESNLKSYKSRLYSMLLIPIAIALMGAIFAFFGNSLFGDSLLNYSLVGFIIIMLGVFIAIFYYASFQANMSRYRREHEALLAKKRILTRFEEVIGKPSERSAVDYFDSLVRINVDNLADYYSLVKIHTDNSFRVSVIAGIIGFALISLGLVVGFKSTEETRIVAFVSSGAGVITEFIAGVFFYLYNRTIRQLKEYHDSLLAVQNILLSFKLVGDIQDEKEKVRMMGKMLAFLISKDSLAPQQNTSRITSDEISA